MERPTARRRSIRLPAYDNASPGTSFVTVCAQDRACVLGEIDEHGVINNPAGQMVDSWWRSIGRRFPSGGIDAYIIMPNHVHGLLRFGWDTPPDSKSAGDEKGRHGGLPLQKTSPKPTQFDETSAFVSRGKPLCLPSPTTTKPDSERSIPVTFGKVIQWFESATTSDYTVGIVVLGSPPYPRRFWQRNYFERIVRDERERDRSREYIAGNPSRWQDDDAYQEFCRGFA